MTKFERDKRYNDKKPVVSFRIERNLYNTILDYMKIYKIDSWQEFMDRQLKRFKENEIAVEYKIKEEVWNERC